MGLIAIGMLLQFLLMYVYFEEKVRRLETELNEWQTAYEREELG